MRTVFLGTSDFAVGVLEQLGQSPHRPKLALTRPDRPRGRGRKLASPPVAEAARRLGIELAQPAAINDQEARELISSQRPDAIVVCAFGALIKEPLLSDYLMLNVHPSLLPRWRGAAPVERAIMAGDSQTGVSIMRVTAGLDSGPVYKAQSEPIRADDTYGTLASRLVRLGGELLIRVLDDPPEPSPQTETDATYAEKITASDRLLDAHGPASDAERTVRALSPHIGAQIELGDGSRLGVLQASALSHGPAPGELSADGPRPVWGCDPGALELLTVHPPGRRAMSGEDYLRGLKR